MNDDRTALESETAVGTALERIFRASQRVLIDRIDLVLLQVQELVAQSLLGIIALAVAVGLILGGWFSLMALAVLLSGAEAAPLVVGAVGVTNLAIGAALVRLAAIRFQAPKLITEPELSAAAERQTAPATGGGVQ